MSGTELHLYPRLTEWVPVETTGSTNFFAAKVRSEGKKQTADRKPDVAMCAWGHQIPQLFASGLLNSRVIVECASQTSRDGRSACA
jgi:hypothetical protein